MHSKRIYLIGQLPRYYCVCLIVTVFIILSSYELTAVTISHTDRYEVYTISKKNDSIQSLDNPSQYKTSTQIGNTKADLMKSSHISFQGLGKFKGEPYHKEVDLSAPPKRTPCRSVPVYQQVAFKQLLIEIQVAGIIKQVYHATSWAHSFVTVNYKNSLTSTANPNFIFAWTSPTSLKS